MKRLAEENTGYRVEMGDFKKPRSEGYFKVVGRGRGRLRRREGHNSNENTTSPGLVAFMPGEVQIRSILNLKKEMAGAIIGRGGSKVQRMREVSGALIHVCPPVRRSDVERGVEITGSIDQVQKAELSIYQLMEETDVEWCRTESYGPRIEIHVLSEMVGCLIGRAGSRVKGIKEELGVTVHVDQRRNEADVQVVQVSGTASNAHIAHGRIMEHLKEFEPSKSKNFLKRIQSQQGKKIEPTRGLLGMGNQGSSGAMVMLQGSQLPNMQSNPQVLIQQPDGSYTLVQVIVQDGGALTGGLLPQPVAQLPNGGLINQGRMPTVPQVQQPQQLQVQPNYGVQQVQDNPNLLVQPFVVPTSPSTGSYSYVGIEAQQQQFTYQPTVTSQLLECNANAQQYGN
eukprot:TRINITY_DN8479_c0_g1_i2.p1 TRINITY_DN8479_c0_g1~~TRINITY_DN8479_c0_g1_i2.p1  ORF type:complete len:397 (-),score=47.73 TRINITY_DN8479_c0_g1_i2:251-1441(-)